MSTYILMKVLESVPNRYDRGIRILTHGRLDKAYNRLVSCIKSGHSVLDLGCGTGALTLRAASKCSRVKGIDINPHMLEIAREKTVKAGFTQKVELVEMGVAELGNEKAENYDAVMGGLCFSELTEDEVAFTLKQVYRILKPEGLLLVADEVRPGNVMLKLIIWLLRFPLVILSYLITQTTTRAVKDLPGKVRRSGLLIESINLSKLQDFMELVARKPEENAE